MEEYLACSECTKLVIDPTLRIALANSYRTWKMHSFSASIEHGHLNSVWLWQNNGTHIWNPVGLSVLSRFLGPPFRFELFCQQSYGTWIWKRENNYLHTFVSYFNIWYARHLILFYFAHVSQILVTWLAYRNFM